LGKSQNERRKKKGFQLNATWGFKGGPPTFQGMLTRVLGGNLSKRKLQRKGRWGFGRRGIGQGFYPFVKELPLLKRLFGRV